MELIKPEDPRYFTQTSNELYDRHHYQLVFGDGQKSIVFEDYEQLRAYWFQCVHKLRNCKVNVIEPKKAKKKSGGFANNE
tara:strand:- start:560 stop:799 length:240 start_codon:yes stop_codon:yes gene_type:complete